MSTTIDVSNVPAQTRAYLRVLYSARFGRRLERAVRRDRTLPAELEFVRSIDFPQLAIEQAARVRNLSHSLRRSCQLLEQAISQEQFRALVAGYAEHALFWRARGRSLGENFCLYAYQALRGSSPRLAELARLDGVCFGVAAAQGQTTPWHSHLGLNHELQTDGQRVSERYHVLEPLFDEASPAPGCGRAATAGAAGEPVAAGGYWIRVSSNGSELRTEVLPC